MGGICDICHGFGHVEKLLFLLDVSYWKINMKPNEVFRTRGMGWYDKGEYRYVLGVYPNSHVGVA